MSVMTRVDLDGISREAREVSYRRGFLAMVAAVLFSVGWFIGIMSHSLAWTWVCIREGYRQGRGTVVASAAAHARTG